MTTGEQGLWARLIDSENAIFGTHVGHRAIHSKGTLCAGVFTATPAASKLTVAPHLQGEPIRTHVRFSNAGGDPTKRDGTNDSRGMAVKFYLPGGGTTDISATTVSVFVAKTPEDVLELNRALEPMPETGKPDLDKVGSYLQAHPEAGPAVEEAMLAQAPASFLQRRYFAVHAFKFISADGVENWVRYRWEPEEGEASLEREEARQRDHDYLRADLETRLGRGPQGFRLWIEIAAEGDPIDDPTARWPEDRENVELGRLEITGLAFDRENDGDVLVFDPTRTTDGIELSNDPILLARPHVYAESVLRRSGVPRDT